MLKILIISFITLPLLISCSNNKFIKTDLFLMGTIVSISYPKKDSDQILLAISNLKEWIDQINSNVEDINNAHIGTKVEINNDVANLLKLAKKYNNLSAGNYDITIYTLTSLYGFNTQTYTTPDTEEINIARKNLSFNNIIFDEKAIIKNTNLKIDFGATGKGYLVDKFSNFLLSKNVKNFIINAGGDIYVSGKKNKKSFVLGIRDPKNANNIITKLSITDMSLATSGNYERSFFDSNGKFINHIFSGITKDTVNNYSSVSVIADSAEQADSFATIFYLTDYDNISKICAKYNIPTMVIDLENNRKDFCDFATYEVQ